MIGEIAEIRFCGGIFMAAAYQFRTAFNGFHREDVVHYIEYINANHASQLQQVRSDLDAAQRKLAQLQEKPDLTDRVAELEAQLAAARQELEQAKAERDEAVNRNVAIERHNEAELEAYRRAERMERQAKERIDFLYQRANGVIADAAVTVDGAAGQISDIADQVAGQLAVLREAVLESKQTFSGAAASLGAIRVEE